ncbi:hypothetical protein L1987_31243 [Smallanthus sonchifolius]|uniref:Uncharacterized protein n=1 Tax=Smallanthus sonchifolius TaxID=185202 RepID=A0ACB9I4E5_9ASTR|nr:hypothetical protein L1987_31243 [Smallanthus sonchifolius]
MEKRPSDSDSFADERRPIGCLANGVVVGHPDGGLVSKLGNGVPAFRHSSASFSIPSCAFPSLCPLQLERKISLLLPFASTEGVTSTTPSSLPASSFSHSVYP